MVQRETYLTPQGLKQLQEELEHLKRVRRPEIAVRIHKASETGGTVDNAEYDESKNEQALIEGRIRDLENILYSAVAAPKYHYSEGIAQIGSSVTVETTEGGEQRYKLVGSAEAAPLQSKISNESPVGQALIGRKVGDKVEVKTPAGITQLIIKTIR